jgi:UDP-N-acetylglucosamine 2-epimerase (non-hydrolysing)
MRVTTVVGTRPEIIKLSRVMSVLDQCAEHTIVHTGQNYDYELNEIFFRELGIRRPDHFLHVAGATPGQTVGNILIKADAALEECRPDALLVLGDTNSCLAVYPAKRRKIPIFHMEAGNRCFDFRVPEEINRRIVDHVSDINMVYSEQARQHLLREGLPADQIIKTGSPQSEILQHHRAAIEASPILSRLDLQPKQFFVVSVHREENVDDPAHLEMLVRALAAIADRYRHPLIFSCHPRTRQRLEAAHLRLHERIRALPPLGFFDYVHLQRNAYCTVSDSGTITEESSILGFPAVTVREAHERPEGMDEGTVVMTGLDSARILESIDLAVRQIEQFGASPIVKDYDVPQVSWKVAKIILSYTDYVNRKVWGRHL